MDFTQPFCDIRRTLQWLIVRLLRLLRGTFSPPEAIRHCVEIHGCKGPCWFSDFWVFKLF